MSAGCQEITQVTQLQDLPDALLTQIAQGVDTQERPTVLPLISRRWAGLLQGPGPVWEVVKISTKEAFPGETEADTAAVAAWFGWRAGSVRDLHITGGRDSVPKLPTSLLATVLASQAPSLRSLNLEVGAAVMSSADLGVLAALTALADLALKLPVYRDHPSAGWDDHAAAVIGTVSRLPALKSLDYQAWEVAAPTVNELAAFRSPTLAKIGWLMDNSLEGTLALGDLPALKECSLDFFGLFLGDGLHVESESFGSATGLVKLCLAGHDIHLAPGCLNRLSMLEDLNLSYCELSVVPEALSGVRGTLRKLDLSGNDKLQIDQAGFDTLMALRVLEDLDLRKIIAPEEYLKWTAQSTRFLVKFSASWSKLHPRAAVPVLEV